MTTYFMHMDPTVFPEPKAFRPERWLDIAPESLEYAYCVPFGKGSRSCGGET
jgi:cytochrome P450